MELIQNLKDLVTDFTEMNKRDAYNHLVRVYGDDKDMVERGMKKWNEANPNSKGTKL
jgi:hypothetical protein